jgi:hypothetical protein
MWSSLEFSVPAPSHAGAALRRSASWAGSEAVARIAALLRACNRPTGRNCSCPPREQADEHGDLDRVDRDDVESDLGL